MNCFEILLFKIKRKLIGVQENLKYRLISGEHFYSLLKDYLNEIISQDVDSSVYHTIVLNNAFEPFDPERFINFFHDARCIVVDRDPRDIYTAANQFSIGFNDQVDLYRNIAGAFDVDVFIKRIKTYRNHVASSDSSKILRINFEDLILRYDKTVMRIYSFLSIDSSKHKKKFKYFNPEKSKKNINTWQQFDDQDAIRKIRRELCCE
jgi:hypothetical protein